MVDIYAFLGRHWKPDVSVSKTGTTELQQYKLFIKMCELCRPRWADIIVGCRLIALDKCPVVRMIGVGDVLRQIIYKATPISWCGKMYRMQLALCSSVLGMTVAVKRQFMHYEPSLRTKNPRQYFWWIQAMPLTA